MARLHLDIAGRFGKHSTTQTPVIRRTILEWESIAYGMSEGTIPQGAADRIAVVAAASPLAGSGGGGVLEHGRKALRARGVVGVIAAEDCAVEILPKIDVAGEVGGQREPAAFANDLFTC